MRRADVGKPKGSRKTIAEPQPGFVDAGDGYALGIAGGKLIARRHGKPLASVPKPLRAGELAEQLLAAIDMLDAHALECIATVETWMLRSLATPRGVLETVWRDEAWRTALHHAAVVGVDTEGRADVTTLGLLAGVDAHRGMGVIDLDGETRWIDTTRVLIPHPVLLAELDGLRALASEISASQGIAQLFREVYRPDPAIDGGSTAVREFENGRFAMLQHALGVAKSLGYRVSGGSAITRVWERGRVVEARYFLGGSGDPMTPTETGELGWVDDAQRPMTVASVPAIAFSEGMRMAAAIFAKRSTDTEELDD